MDADRLLQAAAAVDVLDAAGRIVANPRRNAIAATSGEVLALALATEQFWQIALEAEVLVRTLEKHRPWDGPIDKEAWASIAMRAGFIRGRMREIRNIQPNEET